MGINGINADFSCFRTLAVNFVSDLFLFLLLEELVERPFNPFCPMEFYTGGAIPSELVHSKNEPTRDEIQISFPNFACPGHPQKVKI